MRFTKIAITALAATMALTVGVMPAMANTGTVQDHLALWNTLEEVGVSTHINQETVCKRDIDGAYYGRLNALVICQDNGVAGGPEVEWTANDLDTLRHETQHLIQDCVDGVAGNDSLDPLFDSEEEVLEFVARSPLTQGQVRNIINNYAERGLDREGIVLELEAFATAASVHPSTLAEAVTTYCSAN